MTSPERPLPSAGARLGDAASAEPPEPPEPRLADLSLTALRAYRRKLAD